MPPILDFPPILVLLTKHTLDHLIYIHHKHQIRASKLSHLFQHFKYLNNDPNIHTQRIKCYNTTCTFIFIFLFVNCSCFFRTIDPFFGMLKDLKWIKKKNREKRSLKKTCLILFRGMFRVEAFFRNLCQRA